MHHSTTRVCNKWLVYRKILQDTFNKWRNHDAYIQQLPIISPAALHALSGPLKEHTINDQAATVLLRSD